MAKKCVFLLALIAMSLFVCALGAEAPEPMFKTVYAGRYYSVVYEKETKVMYAVSDGAKNRGTFTLLVNADGTPMIWKEADDG